MHLTPQQYPLLITLAIMIPMLVLRNRAPRVLHPGGLWIAPVIVTALLGLGVWAEQYQPGHAPAVAFDAMAWVILAIGLILGCAFGWWRGKMITIERAGDGTLRAQASPLGMILFVAAYVARNLLKDYLTTNASSWHVNPLAVVDAFTLFIVGMIVMQRVEMFIRARRIQAGKSDSHVESVA